MDIGQCPLEMCFLAGVFLTVLNLGGNSLALIPRWEKHGHLGTSITSGAFYDGEVFYTQPLYIHTFAQL